MTRLEARQAAEIMLAYAEGRKIEFRRAQSEEEWKAAACPFFDWLRFEYRIYKWYKND